MNGTLLLSQKSVSLPEDIGDQKDFPHSGPKFAYLPAVLPGSLFSSWGTHRTRLLPLVYQPFKKKKSKSL